MSERELREGEVKESTETNKSNENGTSREQDILNDLTSEPSSIAVADKYHYVEEVHTKTGEEMHMAKANAGTGSLSSEEYKAISGLAKKHGGYWNRTKKGFHFKTKEDADAFLGESTDLNGGILYRIDEEEVRNEQFNDELRRYKEGKMDKNEILHLGLPYGAISQFIPNLPIVMNQHTVRKGTEKKHHVSIEALEDFPRYISNPIFIFQIKGGDRIGILTEIKDDSGKNVCVAIEMDKNIPKRQRLLTGQ